MYHGSFAYYNNYKRCEVCSAPAPISGLCTTHMLEKERENIKKESLIWVYK